jgi:spermidine/putrescine transport system substrate-binding protein
MKAPFQFNRYAKILALVVVFSFMWGGWWGFYRQERNQPSANYKESVRILALRNFLPPEFIHDFQKSTRVRLHVTEKDSDIELLREALSRNQDYDLIQITSFIAKSFIIDNVLVPTASEDGASLVANLSHVSIDFKGMDYDPENKHLLPITWGLNGFLINTQKYTSTTDTLQDLLSAKTASVLDSPVELFSMVTKLKPIIKNWVETGQIEELHRDLSEMRSQLKKFATDPRVEIQSGALDVAQVANGQVAKILANKDSHFRFVLPKDRATMWITYLGVSRGVRDIDTTLYVLNQFLQPKISERLVSLNEQATVLETLNASALPALQKASYVRDVPLSRVELFINHEALEPTWNDALQKDLFKSHK